MPRRAEPDLKDDFSKHSVTEPANAVIKQSTNIHSLGVRLSTTNCSRGRLHICETPRAFTLNTYIPITSAQAAPTYTIRRQDVAPGYTIDDPALRSVRAAVDFYDFVADCKEHPARGAFGGQDGRFWVL